MCSGPSAGSRAAIRCGSGWAGRTQDRTMFTARTLSQEASRVGAASSGAMVRKCDVPAYVLGVAGVGGAVGLADQ